MTHRTRRSSRPCADWGIRQVTDMKQLFQLEDRNLFSSMIALSLIGLLATVLLNLAVTAYTNQMVKDTYATIVGTVAQKYPQAEAQVVQDLSVPDALSVSQIGRA